MQGQLHEIDVYTILQLIELGQRTGELWLQADHQAWLISVVQGRIVHASSVQVSSMPGRSERLEDCLYRLPSEVGRTEEGSEVLQLPLHMPEYDALWQLLKTAQISREQGIALVQRLVDETLFDVLSLHAGAFRFELGNAPASPITTLEIGPRLKALQFQLHRWKQLYPTIVSPEQCPQVIDAIALRKQVGDEVFQNLTRWADGTLSLRRMARRLNRSIVTVAQAIYPYVEAHLMRLQLPRAMTSEAIAPPPQPTSHVIVCIDDALATLEILRQTLQTWGYTVRAFHNPLEAVGELLRDPPALVLCDIDMPKLNGYELCAMLRQTQRFQQRPIIMLTGKEGFVDRTQARLVGATDYLTKPFSTDELHMLLEKYIGPGNSSGQPFNAVQEEYGADALQGKLGHDNDEAKLSSDT